MCKYSVSILGSHWNPYANFLFKLQKWTSFFRYHYSTQKFLAPSGYDVNKERDYFWAIEEILLFSCKQCLQHIVMKTLHLCFVWIKLLFFLVACLCWCTWRAIWPCSCSSDCPAYCALHWLHHIHCGLLLSEALVRKICDLSVNQLSWSWYTKQFIIIMFRKD